MYPCHHCDTPLCVNDQHLFHGTQKDNIRDAMKKGRFHQNLADHSPFDWTGRKHTPETREKMRLSALEREAARRALGLKQNCERKRGPKRDVRDSA
jgi:hypothetical protein